MLRLLLKIVFTVALDTFKQRTKKVLESSVNLQVLSFSPSKDERTCSSVTRDVHV